MREVNNLKGNQFARYISLVLMNGQTYIIDTTSLMEKKWVRCQVGLSKAGQHRLAAEQQPQGMPVTDSENDAYDTAEDTTIPDTTQLKSQRQRLQEVK
uniref:Uncharacterized protein n=1 Tax=Romanomermis culicivorax TaxID=13658 RepID=A0A915HW14_ROMCU